MKRAHPRNLLRHFILLGALLAPPSGVFAFSPFALADEEEKSAPQMSVMSGGREYRVTGDKSGVEARMAQSNEILWKRTIMKCNRSGKLINREILSGLQLEDGSLRASSEFGASYYLSLADGEVREAGGSCIEKEARIQLRKSLTKDRMFHYFVDGVEVLMPFPELLQAASSRDSLKAFLADGKVSELRYDWPEDPERRAVQREMYLAAKDVLERARAHVIYDGGKSAEFVLFGEWSWIGCGGDCRQRGRVFILPDYSHAFLSGTESFAHGRWGPE